MGLLSQHSHLTTSQFKSFSYAQLYRGHSTIAQALMLALQVDNCFDWQSVEDGRLVTSNITCLNLQVHCRKTADVGQKMIEHLQSSMIHLEISFNISEYCRVLGLGFLQPADRARAGQEVIKSLFRHVLYGVGQQHKLRTLHLNQVPLSDLAASKLTAAVEMSGLHSLGLQKCDEPVSLLSKIQPIGCPLRMDMRCLIVTCTFVGAGDGIDDFLERFSGLQHLFLDSEGETAIRPALTALQNHAASLKTLYLECAPITDGGDDEDECHYDCEELQNFLSQCANLEQLALNTPFVQLEFDKSRIKSHIRPFAEALAAAPALRTFRGLTVRYEDRDDELDVHAGIETFTANAMQTWASQYLNSASQIMAFSICHSRDEYFVVQGIRMKPGFYCRGQIIRPYGRTEATALEMSRQEVMEVEPASEILQLDLNSHGVLRYGYER
ncbi:hypothetical protein EJ03DRAFT_155664 [Teratosphaeria nubilosa]|uniref:Uncharacterized protein n=1 Tax=Teratosphaeria nubilosa TaxID=161662 RepID=A0A6G1LKU0_9PEZI|nr:hypothetical protein EJ03DRAFT_155664 [Teratosphaeria nubilosa]